MPRGIYEGRHGPSAIADAPIYCQQCGKEMPRVRMPGGKLMSRSVHLKRKFCGRGCEGAAFSARSEKAGASWATAHHHARNMKPSGPCERCGGFGRDVHHRDENPLNNDAANLERLCRSCHVTHHKQKGMCGV